MKAILFCVAALISAHTISAQKGAHIRDKAFALKTGLFAKITRYPAEAWITTDGVFHCKTAATFKTAALKFYPPTVSTKTGSTTKVTGESGYTRKVAAAGAKKGGVYSFDISGDKWAAKHSVILIVTTAAGEEEEYELENAAIPQTVMH